MNNTTTAPGVATPSTHATRGTTITGRAAAMVSSHTRFEPAKPESTPAHSFIFIDPGRVKNGELQGVWAEGDYVLVGDAEITVNLIHTEEMTRKAIDSLRQQATKVRANAQMECIRIEQQIQSLLALTHETIGSAA